MSLARETPKPIVAREIIEAIGEKRQNLLSSLFDPPTTTADSGTGGGGDTTSNNGGGGGTTSNGGGGGEGGGGGGSTGNGVTTPTTTQQSTTSSTIPSSTFSSTREQVTSITSSRSSTIVQQTTSNGVVTSVTVVTNAPAVVVSTASVGSETSRPSSGSSSNGGLIGGVVGGVVGGLALITLLVLGIIIWRRRRSRTGHGWLLCFGRKPDSKNELDVDWPTFDPTAGAAGVGGTMGERRKNGQHYNNGGTLPNVDDEEGYNGYNGDYNSYQHNHQYEDEMRDMGNNGYPNSAPSYASPTSDNQHYAQQQQQWQMAPMTSFSNGAHSSAPDYSHLDAPEVREERARQQAQAQAMAAAAAAASGGGAYSHHSGGNSPPPTSNGLSRYGSPVGSASPPPNESRPLSGAMNEHRFSQGTAQMLSDNNFFLSSPQFGGEDDNGTVLNESNNQNRPALHLHNPDA